MNLCSTHNSVSSGSRGRVGRRGRGRERGRAMGRYDDAWWSDIV